MNVSFHAMSRRTRRAASIFAPLAVAVLVGCGGGSSTLVPQHASSASPGNHAPSPSPAPTATPSQPSGGTGTMLNPAVVQAAFSDTQTFYQSLPHQSLHSDLAATAAHMVATKQFTAAQPTYGGISATLPNGALALVYADTPEDFQYPGDAPAASARSGRARPQALVNGCSGTAGAPSGSGQHGIAFLVNVCDRRFDEDGHEETFENAFVNDGFLAAGYNVDVVNDTLDNIVALGNGPPLDYLSLATHGAVLINRDNSLGYINESTQAVDAASTATYATDIMAVPPRVVYSFVLAFPQLTSFIQPAWSFTPAFLTEHLRFNPGAVVYFHACFGASPAVVNSVASTLFVTGAGSYYGWTKETGSLDDDGTEGFLLDRLLGEQSPTATGLDAVASQRTPPQRPFPIGDINARMATELRSGPIQPVNPSLYTESDAGADNLAAPPMSDGTTSKLVVTELNPFPAAPPLVLSVPSITGLAMQSETAAGGTLLINGAFPAAQGIVKMTDSSGTSQLPIVSWSQSAVTATLPVDGNGAAGLVQVFDASGNIASNPVPLTQWKGTLTYNEGDQLDALGGEDGNGPGAFGITFALNFRGDVHQVVPSIDTSPAPQNLYYPQVEGDSSATVTTLRGQFTSSQGTPPPDTATLSRNPVVVTMHPAALPLPANAFINGAVTGQPSPCNNGTAGMEGDAGNIFCPGFGYKPTDQGLCTDGDGNSQSLCGGYATFTPGGSFGASGLVDPGLVLFTMDPSSYAITASGANTSFTRMFPDGSAWPASATVQGSFTASNVPLSATPSLRRRP